MHHLFIIIIIIIIIIMHYHHHHYYFSSLIQPANSATSNPASHQRLELHSSQIASSPQAHLPRPLPPVISADDSLK
jgi:hypothetical protein